MVIEEYIHRWHVQWVVLEVFGELAKEYIPWWHHAQWVISGVFGYLAKEYILSWHHIQWMVLGVFFLEYIPRWHVQYVVLEGWVELLKEYIPNRHVQWEDVC